MSEPTKTGHELTMELLMSIVLAKVTVEGELEAMNELLARKLYEIVETEGLNEADQQRTLAEAIQTLDATCALASAFRPHLRSDPSF